ncbi:TPA: hypothetical protein ACOFME_002324 [Staphylococcus aureus]
MDNLATINDEQKENGNDVNEPLNNAVADMKEQVADKKANGNSVSREDVQNIVDNTLSDKGLDKVLNDSQKEKLVVIIYNASQSNAMKTNPESIKKQASKLKNGLSDKVKDFDSKNDGVLSKLWNDFVSWFKNFINAIIDFFKNIF